MRPVDGQRFPAPHFHSLAVGCATEAFCLGVGISPPFWFVRRGLADSPLSPGLNRVLIIRWPIRVYVSGSGHAYHKSPFCPLLMMGQKKSAVSGHVGRKVRIIALREAEELDRRACRG